MRFRESFLPQHREKTYGRNSRARYSRQAIVYGGTRNRLPEEWGETTPVSTVKPIEQENSPKNN